MPLHGKIVVIKRSGGDGTEFPLTATCLFGRKPDCDIRIQLPQVSKEHCRIDLNENKEVILTNLSSVNPTRVNGEVLQQCERLKHGDVITVIDRSFRFEYPPAPTPKKRRSSTGTKTESFKVPVLQDQQVGETVTTEAKEKSSAELTTESRLKDGTNHDNIQRSLEKMEAVESKKDDSPLQSKTTSPFNDLYQMIKQSLDVKTPRKSSASLLQTPTSKFCTPKPVSVKKIGGRSVMSTEDKTTPKKDESKISSAADETKGQVKMISNMVPTSVKKQRKSFPVPSLEMTGTEEENAIKTEAISPQKTRRATPQKFTVCEVVEKVSAQTPKSPVRRRSKEMKDQENTTVVSCVKESKSNSGKAEKVNQMSKKRKSGELSADLPTQQMKKKRVSFGGHLSPELFDKRLPPDSPLRKGAAPRRSLCLLKPKQSVLRRASVIGLLQEHSDGHKVHSPAKTRTPSPKKSSSVKNPKTPSPVKKSPKSKPSSPKAASPAKKSAKPSTPSPKTNTPGKKSPTSKKPSTKAETPETKQRTLSPKAVTPGPKSPKARTRTPKATTPGTKSPKPSTPSPKVVTPGKESPKSKTSSIKATSPSLKSRIQSSESSRPSPTGKSPSRNKAETPKVNGHVTPGVQTPTVKGRFSVSLINTPSPIVEHATADQVPLVTVTPKMPLRRKSMKSTSRKTQSVRKSALKVMCRRSGISRGSMKALSSWANIVKFGQMKAQVHAPAKKVITKKTTKKAVPKPQTPARKLNGHASTGHAESPLTIVVGKAHQKKVVHSTGAVPRLVTNTAFLKKNMKMDVDLTVSEMFKTPVNEKKRRSVINDNSVMKTPLGDQVTSGIDPSVLNTPEEPGEMTVSPLSVSSTVKDKKYNSEAVLRLFNGDQESVFSDIPAVLETSSDSSEQRCSDLKITSAQTPKQKPELPDCLTGVKRIMKTPRQKAEPVEDLRGRLLKTPKQKPEQQEFLSAIKKIFETPQQEAEPLQDIQEKFLEKDLSEETHLRSSAVENSPSDCLSGVKRLMKTPKEKHAPVEDMFGLKRLLKTPREKTEPVEDNFGIKRLLKSPRILKNNAPEEDFEGLKELMEEPSADPTEELEINAVDDQTRLDCGGFIAKELDFALEEPQDDVPSDMNDNVSQIDMQEKVDADEVDGNDHLREQPNGRDELSPAIEATSPAAIDENLPTEETNVDTREDHQVDPVEEIVPEELQVDPEEQATPEEQAEMEPATGKVTEIDTTADDLGDEKTSVRSRRGKKLESKSTKKQGAEEHPADRVVPALGRARRAKKNEATAPPTVRQTSRRRNLKTPESADAELTVEKNVSLVSNFVQKPKTGRNAKKSSDTAVAQEIAPENILEPENVRTPGDVTVETAVLKPKRGRRCKQLEKSEPEKQDVPQSDEVPQANMPREADADKVSSGQLEELLKSVEKKSEAMKTIPQVPEAGSLPEVETSACNDTKIEAATVQEKSVRGRKAKVVPSKPDEDEEVNEQSDAPVVLALVRGRRGKKVEATAMPAVRQTTRSRNAKSQESISNHQPEVVPENVLETTQDTEITSETVSDQTSPVKTKKQDESASTEKTGMRTTRGRKRKMPAEPVESDQNEAVSEENPVTDAPIQKSVPSVGKPRRGRKPIPDNAEKSEPAENTVVTVETKQDPQPPVRAKRGRNAKVEEEKLEISDTTTSVEISKSQEPVKKLRRTRKTEQNHVEQSEIQNVEVVVAEAPVVAEPLKTNEPAVTAPRTTRGGRRLKKSPESEVLVKSTEVSEVSAASSTDKHKPGRRGKQVADEDPAAEGKEKPNQELKTEEKNEEEPPLIKSSRARGSKKVLPVAVPTKRARRGVSPPQEETNAASSGLISESASVEPGKRRGRPAKSVKDVTATTDKTNPTENQSEVKEDAQKSKRSVRWKNSLEVFEIVNATPQKPARGRKSKLEDRVDMKSQNASKNTSKTEEDLSEEVAEAQPPKRARRGSKAVSETSNKDESTNRVKNIEAEPQPKIRRGRSAKK
ncbi:proliferation marker protein Ki-67 isoform X2 [Antennarius striatus]|uniref:proliferation marker protein Ki-67 isoform X2 n=1 Tax=Antennarius striatus TaxID=241820 RepID=UPI0035B0FBFD